MLNIEIVLHILYVPPEMKDIKTKLQPRRKVAPNTGMGVEVGSHQPKTQGNFLSVWRFFISVFM